MRTFISIKPSALWIKGLFSFLNSNSIQGRQTPNNQIHLTLSFLGELGQNDIDSLCQLLENIPIKTNQLIPKEIDFFPRSKRSQLIALQFSENTELNHLYQKLQTLLMTICPNLDQNKPFIPHLTLYRKVNPSQKGLKDILPLSCVSLPPL